jgi:hypothetical protein
MGIIDKVVGPRSKRDKSLPYAYEARIDILAGQASEALLDHYFSSTICGLIEYLEGEDIAPGDVTLFGVYRGQQYEIATEPCLAEDGSWLSRPELCHSLEEHYARTLEECYRGHVEKGTCSYDDRDRDGVGPVW